MCDCEMIPELTRLKCKQKENQKGKGTDETPLVHNCGYIALGSKECVIA